MTAPMKPFYSLFSFTLILGISMVLSSNNWMIVWAGLELNLYSFIPLLLSSKINQEKEAAVKYFLFQALASGLLLLGAISSQYQDNSPSFLFLALLMKLGMAPCHFWFPIVMNSISWNMCWLLSTIQKISPMTLLISCVQFQSTSLLTIVASMNALLGGLGGLNQTQLRAILAYSSIGHMGWMSSGLISSNCSSLWYFIMYLILISSIIPMLALNTMKTNNFSTWSFSSSSTQKVLLLMALLSLSGMPPTLGFFPKMFMISSLMENQLFLLSFILVVSSAINLFYYMKIGFNLFLSVPSSSPFSPMHTLPPRMLFMSLLLSAALVSATLSLPLLSM
uniref:NADH-ubiquinone oxidoreductase chain 2 n=1 Tax=Pectinaria gouldii TaxID=260746 RepID=G8XXJ8_PECGU|nr:NADH dehydrogenase subunit 2 [Pectinaria gouldii]